MNELLSNPNQLNEPIERLMLCTLRSCDVLHLESKNGELHDFTVIESGILPEGLLYETRPDVTNLDWVPAVLIGCGLNTSRVQNPVQTQEKAFTPHDGVVSLGCFLSIKEPNTTNATYVRYVFDNPGQEISKITVDKFSPK